MDQLLLTGITVHSEGLGERKSTHNDIYDYSKSITEYCGIKYFG